MPLFLQLFVPPKPPNHNTDVSEAFGGVFVGTTFIIFLVVKLVILVILDVNAYAHGCRIMKENLKGNRLGGGRKKKHKKKNLESVAKCEEEQSTGTSIKLSR